MDCIFCKIIKGEIPCYKIYEDEFTLAFLDIANDLPGHTLVIPKKHFHNILDCPNSMLHHVMDSVKLISKHYVEDLGYDSVNLSNVNELVPHFHIHIYPRKKGDGFVLHEDAKNSGADMDKICKELKL